ncbi:inositol monophosphatase family protein [Falsihalocynthiibacter sp. S25ZX9]|uniref:inositol monophosphatase family protein n=1 Tax=Falsihalocynthiibacter sp. S25ZX9 TaxID=3240870 RepID=UPI00350F2801
MNDAQDFEMKHAQGVADIAAEAARGYFRNPLQVEFKADESPVTQADRGVESKVRAYLGEHFPDDGIWGEEHGTQGEDREWMWVVDPIDGTRSFLSGNPLFGFLAARMHHGVPEIGVIGMPALGETLIGKRNGAATLNGQKIQTSTQTSLDHAVLYINEADKIYQAHPEVFAKLVASGQTRRFAYDCYPHALVAMGHVDAVVDYDLQPYDYLAVLAVVEAAGGIMTDWQGRTLTDKSACQPVICAATPELHAQLLAIVSIS